jgi:large subunit ribosomal protein L7/L12
VEAAAVDPASFTVILKEVGPQKLYVIKTIHELTNILLTKAQTLITIPNAIIIENVSRAKAEDIKAGLELVGATVNSSRQQAK